MKKSAGSRKKRGSPPPAENASAQPKWAKEVLQQKLADSLAMMRATLESTTDAIVLTNGVAKVTGFNEKYAELMGLSRAAINRMGVEELRKIFSRQFKDPGRFIEETKAIYAAGLAETFDLIEFADGRVFERYSKLQKIDNRTVGRVWSFRDVTERKRSEEKLQTAKNAAEKANKAKDNFLALLSHELRTPLTPALAAASYMAEHEDLLPEFREELTAVWRNVQLEARLIDDLLDVTRIARGKIDLRRETVDAHRLLRDAVAISRKDMVEKRIELVMKLDAIEHHIWADPVRIQQVFWNLINNSVKFTQANGRITLTTSSHGKRFTFEIEDTGIGVEPKIQGDIFNAFDQGDPSITRQFGGLGLGLTISKRLLDLHKGTISVQSEGANRGACFNITLPAVPAPAGQPSTATNGRDRGGSTKSLRLLIVDDDADTRRILSRLLSKCGHQVASVDCAKNALELLGSDRFDSLISDIGLPDSSGYELVREAKQRQPLKGIALSGFGTDADIQRSMEAGFDYHLTKPITFQDLRSLLERMC